MDLTNSFTLAVPVERAWQLLTDLEGIAPCMPGAALTGREDDAYLGQVSVKLGPITSRFKGQARFVTKDDAAHRAVIRAEGRDTRGQGNATATITATLRAEGDATHVDVVTDLAIAGKVAQFGRGVLADVSAKLVDQFVANVEQQLLSEAEPESDAVGDTTDAAPDAAPAPPAPAPAAPAPAAEPEPIDLLGTAGSALRARLVAAAGVVVALVAGVVALRRARR